MLIFFATLVCIFVQSTSVPISEFYPFGADTNLDTMDSTSPVVSLTNSESIILSSENCDQTTVGTFNVRL